MARYTGTTQYRNYTLRLDVSEASYSTTDNSSSVSWTLYIVNNGYRFNAKFHYSVTIDGSKRKTYGGNVNTTDVSATGGVHKLASGTYTVPHNADGTKKAVCSAECSGGGSYGPGTGSCSGTLTLTTIPRTATLNSFSGNDIDGNFSAGITKTVSEWTCYLRLSIGDTQIQRIDYNTSGTTFRLTDEAKNIIYSTIGNADTVNIKAVLETWNGSTKVGESSAITNTCSVNRNVWININGTWKRGIPYVKINGTWKVGVPYIKINGEWKKAI